MLNLIVARFSGILSRSSKSLFISVGVSCCIVFLVLKYEKVQVVTRYNKEIELAEQTKVINELLFKFKLEREDEMFFYNYFKPITEIGFLEILQFVSESNGEITHTKVNEKSKREMFDFRKRSWYQCAKNLNSRGDFCISNTYQDYWPPHKLTLTYSYPIFNGNEFIGVGLHDIYLSDINDDVVFLYFKGVSSEGTLVFRVLHWNVIVTILVCCIALVYWCKCFIEIKRRIYDYLYRDELTKLPTRKSFKYLVLKPSVTAICVVDIDNFKRINDNFGHDVGDVCLSDVARIMKSSIRKSDVIYRWGGEEFLLVLDDVNCYTSRTSILERLRYAVKKEYFELIDGNITITIGFCAYTNNDNVIDAIKNADRALYVGKNSGRDKVVEYT